MAESTALPAACVDGRPASSLPLDDRGLAYGDGVFETVLLHRGEPVWWQAHLDRLAEGAGRLGIAAPPSSRWDDDLRLLRSERPVDARAVLKLMLTRGSGGRGYSPAGANLPRRIAMLHPAPAGPAQWNSEGIVTRWCQTRLARQPRLAGSKHLNRLEQVLARAEWNDPEIAEGLMRDVDGRVVCATAGNLFVRIDGRWRTPSLTDCGVAGICRAALLDLLGEEAEVAQLDVDDVERSEALFVCSSVRGILPLLALGDRRWSPSAHIATLRRRLAAAQPAFAPDPADR